MNVDLVKTSLDKPLVEHSGLSIESLPASEEGKRDCVYTLGSRRGEDMSVLKARSTGSLARDSTKEERSLLADASCPDSSISAAEHTGKRKEPPKFTGSRFKAVGNVVLAMKRFQGWPLPRISTWYIAPLRRFSSFSSIRLSVLPGAGTSVLFLLRAASINPTVTFGKPPSSAGGSGSSGGAAAPASLQVRHDVASGALAFLNCGTQQRSRAPS